MQCIASLRALTVKFFSLSGLSSRQTWLTHFLLFPNAWVSVVRIKSTIFFLSPQNKSFQKTATQGRKGMRAMVADLSPTDYEPASIWSTTL
jgi:hypothetical protein